jgi:hypothetical protein
MAPFPHNPISALVFIFRMSDVQFRVVRKRSNKSEKATKRTDSRISRSIGDFRCGLPETQFAGNPPTEFLRLLAISC